MTALQGIDDHLRVRPRETVAIFGASGAVGKEQVMAAPEYKEDTPIVALGAAGSLQPFEFDH